MRASPTGRWAARAALVGALAALTLVGVSAAASADAGATWATPPEVPIELRTGATWA